jgi:hypothetical protein
MGKKSKTFTGCWTCRARKVKCDESQPICNRCTKAGRICEGYGVRLTWQGNETETSFRVLIDLDTEGAEIPPDDLDDMINKCWYTEASHETQTFGPFSVFRIGQKPESEASEPPQLDTKGSQEDQRLVGETAINNSYTPSLSDWMIGTSQHSLPEISNDATSDVTMFDVSAYQTVSSNQDYVDENNDLVLDELLSAEGFFGPSSFDLESRAPLWAELEIHPFDMESDFTSAAAMH